MTRRDLIDIWNILEELADLPGAPQFAYAVVKNRALLRSEIDAIEKARTRWPKGYEEFERWRLRLCASFAKKDATGNSVEDGARFVMDPEREGEFKERMDALTKEHAEPIKAFEKHREDYNKFIDEPVDRPEFVRLDIDQLPQGVTARQIETLETLICERRKPHLFEA